MGPTVLAALFVSIRQRHLDTMRKLLIVESPHKIKTIGKFLGPEFKIMSTVGHIKDLPSNKLGIQITEDQKIILEYQPLKDKAEVIAQICKQARTCDEIYLASDPDREGEIISWHIEEEIAKVIKKNSSIHRIVFNEITKPAIEGAIVAKRSIDAHKVHAQQARRVLDRWVGYEVSPILWRKIMKGLSAGRVQSVALMLVCDREKEIEAFKPEEYWSIHALFAFKGELFEAELHKADGKKLKITTKEQADAILAKLAACSFSVTDLTEKKRLKQPAPPFMTSTLQQDAYNKLGFAVERTMNIAQKLYEGVPLSDKNNPEALITYMRTDSLRLSDTALTASRAFIKKQYGDKYLPSKSRQFDTKGATQDAHEAVRPINVDFTPEQVAAFLKPEQAKLYELIWRRFVASQMEAAEFFQRAVTIDGGEFEFKATGSSLMFDGFLKIYRPEEEDEEASVSIPKDIAAGAALSLNKKDSKQHFTKPPARYSQATLIKELDKRDIGRPSTYATIISTLIKRQYATVDNKRFVPSELGRSVTNLLVQNLPDIINVNFTAQMEQALDKIAAGELNRDELLLSFYKTFSADVEKFGGINAKKQAEPTNLACPECKEPLCIRFGKGGEFLGCSGFPECTFTSNFARQEDGSLTLVDSEKPAMTATNLSCPKCSKTLVERIGRFGPFITCPGYPECKYIHQEKLQMPCPKCGSAIGKRSWRGGEFWGCTGYPKCNFAIFSKVVEEQCPQCKKSPYLLLATSKDGVTTHTCPDKEGCGYKQEV